MYAGCVAAWRTRCVPPCVYSPCPWPLRGLRAHVASVLHERSLTAVGLCGSSHSSLRCRSARPPCLSHHE
eukprot:4552692-Alexandrium_andersonii.AAC.1